MLETAVAEVDSRPMINIVHIFLSNRASNSSKDWISQTSLHLGVAMCLSSEQWVIAGSGASNFQKCL